MEFCGVCGAGVTVGKYEALMACPDCGAPWVVQETNKKIIDEVEKERKVQARIIARRRLWGNVRLGVMLVLFSALTFGGYLLAQHLAPEKECSCRCICEGVK